MELSTTNIGLHSKKCDHIRPTYTHQIEEIVMQLSTTSWYLLKDSNTFHMWYTFNTSFLEVSTQK